jgi:hypothetical protein
MTHRKPLDIECIEDALSWLRHPVCLCRCHLLSTLKRRTFRTIVSEYDLDREGLESSNAKDEGT